MYSKVCLLCDNNYWIHWSLPYRRLFKMLMMRKLKKSSLSLTTVKFPPYPLTWVFLAQLSCNLASFVRPLFWHSTMPFLVRKTGRVSRNYIKVWKLRIHSKWASLASVLILSTTSLVSERYTPSVIMYYLMYGCVHAMGNSDYDSTQGVQPQGRYQ